MSLDGSAALHAADVREDPMNVLRRFSIVSMAAALAAGSGLLGGCLGNKSLGSYQSAMNGNPDTGKALIQSYGCGSCHVVPGIRGARGEVGPPLLYYSRRTIIAGELPNTPGNLAEWIQNPVGIEPGTAMPNLGVTESQAHDMAAYLYTLR
jgi:cytochrome c